jgi:Tfp pilus assembly protein PilN
MIIVNLLPHHLRPIKRTPMPYMITGLVLALTIAGLAALFLQGQLAVNKAKGEHEAKKNELGGLSETVREFNELADQKGDLDDRINTIKGILADRMIWSQQLHSLASLTPDNIWYERIRVFGKPVTKYRKKTDPRTGETLPPNPTTGEFDMESYRAEQQVLEITGYVTMDDQGNRRVNALMLATQEDPEFSKLFEMGGPKMEPTEFNGEEVQKFTLPYIIIEEGGEE